MQADRSKLWPFHLIHPRTFVCALVPPSPTHRSSLLISKEDYTFQRGPDDARGRILSRQTHHWLDLPAPSTNCQGGTFCWMALHGALTTLGFLSKRNTNCCFDPSGATCIASSDPLSSAAWPFPPLRSSPLCLLWSPVRRRNAVYSQHGVSMQSPVSPVGHGFVDRRLSSKSTKSRHLKDFFVGSWRVRWFDRFVCMFRWIGELASLSPSQEQLAHLPLLGQIVVIQD